MSCIRHFLTFHWEHHEWRPQVTLAETIASRETDIWGRRHGETFVRCHKHEVCEACGQTRRAAACLCDTGRGEHCAIRLDWIAQQAAAEAARRSEPAL